MFRSSCWTGSWAAPSHPGSRADPSFLLCVCCQCSFQKVKVGINLIIAVCIGTALSSQEEILLMLLFGCVSQWSASHCGSKDSTCSKAGVDILAGDSYTSSSSSPSLAVYFFLLLLCLHILCPHTLSLHTPALLQRPTASFSLAGSAVWEDDGGGGWRSIHRRQLDFPEFPGSLHEADQWGFSQWCHEGHVSFINIFLLHYLKNVKMFPSQSLIRIIKFWVVIYIYLWQNGMQMLNFCFIYTFKNC